MNHNRMEELELLGLQRQKYSEGGAQGGHKQVLLNCLTTEEDWRGLVQAFHCRGGLHAYNMCKQARRTHLLWLQEGLRRSRLWQTAR